MPFIAKLMFKAEPDGSYSRPGVRVWKMSADKWACQHAAGSCTGSSAHDAVTTAQRKLAAATEALTRPTLVLG